MKKKIVAIVILMLVATTVVSATNINVKETIQTKASGDVLYCNNKIETFQPALFDWWNVDQKQTHQDSAGMQLRPPSTCAQGFTPTKDKLTAVSLYIFKHGTPPDPVQITVSIRDNLTGPDLATKTIDTSVVTIDKYKWVLFDFEDISITPDNPYFIICSGNAGDNTNVYCWFFSDNDIYSRGEAWYKATETADWITLKDAGFGADFCFKTYFRKPLDISVPKTVPSYSRTGMAMIDLSATNINVKEKIQPTLFGVDVPVWEKGDSWTYNEQYVNHIYTANGTLWYLIYHNCTSTYTVTDTTGDNYTVTMTSTDNEGRVTIGSIHLKFTKYTKFTCEFKLRKTDLALVSESWQEKGPVFWLLFNIVPIPAQYTDAWENTYSVPDVTFPFPLTAGTHGPLPNASCTGHEKCSLFWGLITLFNWPDTYGYSGDQNYTCEMANISVPAGTYDAYNVSVESTYGLGHLSGWSYYVPEVGWKAKQISSADADISGNPGWSIKSELVSTTYTP